MRKALLVLGLAVAALAATAGTALAKNDKPVGAVYVQSNTSPNYVRVFYRNGDGSLTPAANVFTGGNGAPLAPPLGLAITDSANSVALTPDNEVLLVSNAGSNTISSFRVDSHGNIRLVDQISSGGIFPVSIAVTGNGPGKYLAYALNEGATTVSTAFEGAHGSISGFKVTGGGKLKALSGTTHAITGGFNSAAIGFNGNGRVLTVTNRNTIFAFAGAPNGSISTWKVDSDGRTGSEVVTPALGPGAPFGFAYSKSDQLLVSNNGTFEGGVGSASSYAVNSRNAAVTGVDDQPSGSVTCWAVVTKDGKYAYFSSVGPPGPISGEGSLSGFSLANNGHLTNLFIQPTAGGGGLDIGLSRDSKYLYQLSTDLDFLAGINEFIGNLPNITPSVFPFGDSRVTAYKVNNDGSLTLVGTVPAGTGGNSGVASF
ncbi:MAG TPA: beta-propeller fold lactonase family protein [Gaiellaceae bacterium]